MILDKRIKSQGVREEEHDFYSCGLSTATIEYSLACVCVSVCVCMSVSVCVCVCLCVCKHDNSKNN